MTSQKHTVATDALETLGTFPIPDNSGRDAIHLAVEPAIAGMSLYPGDRIRISEGKAEVCSPEFATGIVDPFVFGKVREGQRFWLVVLPRTITSLRHVWSHPAFPEEATYHAEADEHYVADSGKAASEEWLRAFCERSDCPDYATVIAAAQHGSNSSWSNEYLHFNDRDAHGDIPPEFWDHVEVVTGNKIAADNRAAYFSCSF